MTQEELALCLSLELLRPAGPGQYELTHLGRQLMGDDTFTRNTGLRPMTDEDRAVLTRGPRKV